MKDNKETESFWQATTDIQSVQELKENIETDICIVGAGIGGLTTAYLLTKSGKKVVVVEMNEIASGQSGRTTAQISYQIDDRYDYISERIGKPTAKIIAESQSAALNKIAEIVKTENISCSFERLNAYLFCPPGEKDDLNSELKALHEAGLTETYISEESPIDSFRTGRNIVFPNQAQFHPLEYLKALKEIVIKNGGQIFTSTKINKVESKDNLVIATTEKENTITAKHVVVATHSPMNDLLAIHTKQAPYRTYVIGAKIPKGSVNKGLYWDTLDPYHYIRISEEKDHDVLIIGGEDHKTGQSDDETEPFINLEAWSKVRFPMIEEITYKWSGQVQEPVDGIAFLGKNPGDQNVYIITGDSGTGMTNCTVGAMIITDLINGKENNWESTYSPSRISIGAVDTFIKEGVNVAAQFTDWVSPGDVKSENDLSNGQGAVIRDGLSKLAVYKDENGQIHKCSAVCPHLGCIVDWNNLEKSFDCPCHGSRFDAYGKVITAPTSKNLEKIS